MATVYLARDVRHDRQVAMKVLRAELAATCSAPNAPFVKSRSPPACSIR